ncbi:uncharacterized protein A1O9_07032 [Exophiala aquamarina CBS 119918]|uniref:Phytocyanin domain-containing protein n=1 Tax=Exophiala aquamarina CBS 119918 TaxID=1182545 RepID=A0A072PAR9_9EURO|nr:uncharacterized protein A1O9_07032 [Exophiala aquamarina CBS 119918]KEF56842.1 hypothetical protein A1O9_07032 [Exophiala aquamarina CBS 119918]
MSSLRTFLVSTILATAAVATSHDFNSGGGGGNWQPPSNGNGWNSWEQTSQSPHQTAPPQWQAAPSCPAGCIPIPTGGVTPPPPGQLMVQVVSVADANGSLKYFPNKIDAPVGSIVQFQFHPKNHTITESSFAEPCKPLAADMTSAMRPGVRSGFIPVKGDEPFTPVYNVLVNDTKPIWIFCGQVNHCQRGMAMVINQPKDSPNTIEKYIENAAKLPTVSMPAPPPSGATAPPPPPAPPAPAATESFTFGGGFPGGGAPPASSSIVEAPPVQTVATSSVAVAPATFTGAASGLNVRDASPFAGVVLGAMVALL